MLVFHEILYLHADFKFWSLENSCKINLDQTVENHENKLDFEGLNGYLSDVKWSLSDVK
jgi:hypothetical protein